MEPERDVVYFGRTNFRSAERLFGVKRPDRRQHMYVIGKSGTGKTTLMHNMMVQDIVNGEGVCVVDPHGEFVESLLKKIPEHRKQDVVYFNPADTESSIGFNVLELPDPKYKHLVASGLMGIFTKIWAGTWSARMEYILNNCVLALLDTPGTTLLGITRLLVDKEYRQRIIGNVKDPVVRSFWINEYEEWKDQFRNEAIAPIQNKVGQFLSTSLIRNIVGQKKSTIDVYDIMNSGKIFLINVSKGRIGEDNSALLGAMIITKIQLAAMERVRIVEDDRVDFFLYVDEFQNFATDSFANILSEARKYRLNLTVGHQYIGQLVSDASTKVRDAIFGNVGTTIVFRVGAADAEFLEKEFTPEFSVQDMVNLPNRAIFVKLMVNGVTSRPFSASTLPPFRGTQTPVSEEEVIEISRKRYAKPRWAIEREINEWSGMEMPLASLEQTPEKKYERIENFSSPSERKSEMNDYQKAPSPREYKKDLADIGIEFESQTYRAPEKSRPLLPRETTRQPFRREFSQPIRSNPSENKSVPEPIQKDSGPRVSLKNLSSNQKEHTKESASEIKPEKDSQVDDLKNALADALKNLE